MSRRSNDTVIYRNLQPYSRIEDGETLAFESGLTISLASAVIIVQTMYCALDAFLVSPWLFCLILAISKSRSCPSIIHPGSSDAFWERLTEGI